MLCTSASFVGRSGRQRHHSDQGLRQSPLGLRSDAVVEDEERQAEQGEGVLGAHVARVDVDLELFAESVDGEQ
jgi:hypothetical protein